MYAFTDSKVQGSIFVPGLHLERLLIRKVLFITGLIHNLEPNRQLLWKMIMFSQNFVSVLKFER